MDENKDRIWDVLIEDALRPEAAEQPAERGEYTRRLLTPVGRVGVDRGRSMRYARPRWVSLTIWTAVMLLVCAVLYAGAVWLPKLRHENNNPEPQSAGANHAPEANGNTAVPAPAPRPNPEPQPEANQPDTKPEPEPEPEPKPEPKPDDTVKQPKPDDTVEPPTPQPKPDDTVEQPEPEPKPDDTVEKPKQPDDTTPEVRLGPTIDLLRADKHADLQVATGVDKLTGKPVFKAASDLTKFDNEAWLTCKRAVDLNAGGVLLRLNGTARITIGNSSDLRVELTDDDLFFDSRGARRTVRVDIEQRSVDASGGSAVLIERHVTGTDVSVYSGEVFSPDGTGEGDHVPAGKKATLKKHAAATIRDLSRSLAEEPFLKGLTDRVLYHEDFDAEKLDGRLREGARDHGIIFGARVFWGYPENIAYQPGLVLRLRIRFTNASAVTVTQFCKERNDNYSYELTNKPARPRELKNDQWYVVELPIDQFLERTTHQGHPQDGESFMNVSIATQGKDAQVQLDWVELIRAVK